MKVIENIYYEQYQEIVDFAKSQNRNRKDQYYENHHIEPISLGGSDNKDNKVLLTPEEHYVCHSLLPDFLEGNDKYKMIWGWHRINNPGYSGKDIDGLKIIGKEKYAELKRSYSDMMSDRMSGENNPMYGVNAYEGKTDNEMQEIAKKKSNNTPWKNGKRPEHSEMMKGENNPMFGKSAFENKTEEEMKVISSNMSERQKGEKNSMFGKSAFENKTEEEMKIIKDNMSKANKERWKNIKSVTCPYCGMIGRGGTMKRWHFDNCKEK